MEVSRRNLIFGSIAALFIGKLEPKLDEQDFAIVAWVNLKSGVWYHIVSDGKVTTINEWSKANLERRKSN